MLLASMACYSVHAERICISDVPVMLVIDCNMLYKLGHTAKQ